MDPLAGGPTEDVLSSCEPAGDQETTTLVEASVELPPVASMEEAVSGNPDAEFMVEQLQEEGQSREVALHQMYAQVVGQQLFADVQPLPGFVEGAYARPHAGEPFELSFAGPVPDELDPETYDLESFGLEVTSGAAGFDHEAMVAAFEAARDTGMQPVSGSGDETAGTGRIEVIDATPEQVGAWEQAVDDPSRWCLVRAPRSVPCDGAVIAAARQRADRQGEVLPNQQGEGGPTAERAEEVRHSYLGLTLEAAEHKAAQEDRAVRVTTQDGVALGGNDDLQPGRLSLAVCDGMVVDTHMDLEPAR
ncbi:MAG: hypothetical protein WD378_02935 [Egicoccus sp.]